MELITVAMIGPELDLKKLRATARLPAEAQKDQAVTAGAAKVIVRRKSPVAAEASLVDYRDWFPKGVDHMSSLKIAESDSAGLFGKDAFNPFQDQPGESNLPQRLYWGFQ